MSINFGEPRKIETFETVRGEGARAGNPEYDALWSVFTSLSVGDGVRVALPPAYDRKRFIKLARAAIQKRCTEAALDVRPSLRLIAGDSSGFMLGKVPTKK